MGRPMAVPFVFAAPCRGGRPCPPDLRPILFFLFWRKKRTAAPGKEKKENFRNRKFSPCRHHVTAQSPSLICPPQITPNCDPAQRSQFGKEEGAGGYGAFAASAEAECSWLLLHAVLMMAARQQPADVVSFLHIKNRPTVWDDFFDAIRPCRRSRGRRAAYGGRAP